ncbi:MAG: penicillin-binding protein [Coriobacteriia bacterium]|nr:penicillin-binding protein [Coriobacteriia bacterium]MCL2536719.1 penicillin-binding protein [Coriobacteriia bacterium]
MGQKPKKKRNPVTYIAYFAGAVVTLTVLLMAVIGYILLQPLPDISHEAIARRSSSPTTIFAIDGSVLTQWTGDTQRRPMSADEFPQVMFDATVAIEDQRFFDHSGLDLRGILRAVQRNTAAGEVVEGGSTITQQLMKMMYAGEDQSMIRKIEEAILASRVEMERDKRDIIAAYLNMAFFGQGSYGVYSASETFFGVEPKDLSIAQAATLAGVLHMPSAYRPQDDPEPLTARRNLVLAAMRDQGFITNQQFDIARAEELVLAPRTARAQDIRYPFFVDLVQRELPTLIDDQRIAQGGLNIYTTLDPAIQDAAEAAAASWNDDADGPTVSLVSMRHSDGAILALIGGKDWDEKQFNVAVQARRQPGSAFKPLTLIAALEDGESIDKSIDARPFEVMVRDEMWEVTNYGGANPGASQTLRAAMTQSTNTVFARLIMEIGPEKVVELAHDMGFAAPMEPDPALSLGGLRYGVSPLEMARAYTTMARAGSDVAPRSILRVTALDPNNPAADQTVLFEADETPEDHRIYSESTGIELRRTLREVVTSGTGARANITGVEVAGKTGTTQNYHDAWFVGWADGVTTAVWMGFPEAQIEMRNIRGRNVSGGSYPAQIFHDYMTAALERRPNVGMYFVPGQTPPVDGEGEEGMGEHPTEHMTIQDVFSDMYNMPSLEELGRAP